jgi:lysophospholipase L1-like esterase
MSQRSNQRLAYKIVLFTFSLFVTCGFCEIIVRLVRPQPTFSKILLMVSDHYTQCDFLPFTLKQGYEAKSPSQEYPGRLVSVHVNTLGLRGPETSIDKPSDVKRILILGDSYTFGVYCEDEEIYPRVLERLYQEQGKKVEVLNAGYADGYTPDEHYAWLNRRGFSFKPDLVIYGFFIGNDIQEIRTEGWRDLDKRGLPTKIENPNLWVDHAGRLRSKISDTRTEGTQMIYRAPILRESHLLVLLNRKISAIIDKRKIDERKKNSGEGWLRALDFVVYPRTAEIYKEKEVAFNRLVQGMSDTVNETGAKFLVLMIPLNYQVEPDYFLKLHYPDKALEIKREYFEELGTDLTKKKIEYIDLLRAMKSHPEVKYYPRNGEVHFNPRGHEFTARQLKSRLDELNWP